MLTIDTDPSLPSRPKEPKKSDSWGAMDSENEHIHD